MTQPLLMTYDPATGKEKPYPSLAEHYRQFHGQVARLFNPWTGIARDPRDIGTDPMGWLVRPPGNLGSKFGDSGSVIESWIQAPLGQKAKYPTQFTRPTHPWKVVHSTEEALGTWFCVTYEYDAEDKLMRKTMVRGDLVRG